MGNYGGTKYPKVNLAHFKLGEKRVRAVLRYFKVIP